MRQRYGSTVVELYGRRISITRRPFVDVVDGFSRARGSSRGLWVGPVGVRGDETSQTTAHGRLRGGVYPLPVCRLGVPLRRPRGYERVRPRRRAGQWRRCPRRARLPTQRPRFMSTTAVLGVTRCTPASLSQPYAAFPHEIALAPSAIVLPLLCYCLVLRNTASTVHTLGWRPLICNATNSAQDVFCRSLWVPPTPHGDAPSATGYSDPCTRTHSVIIVAVLYGRGRATSCQNTALSGVRSRI